MTAEEWVRLRREAAHVACVGCGRPVEDARRIYVSPTCYGCLPPPQPLPPALPPDLVLAAARVGLVRGRAWWAREGSPAAMAFRGDDGVWRWAPEAAAPGFHLVCASEEVALRRAVAWLHRGVR